MHECLFGEQPNNKKVLLTLLINGDHPELNTSTFLRKKKIIIYIIYNIEIYQSLIGLMQQWTVSI